MLIVCLVLQGKQSESDLSEEDKESLSQEIEYKKSLVEAQNLGVLDCVFEPELSLQIRTPIHTQTPASNSSGATSSIIAIGLFAVATRSPEAGRQSLSTGSR